MEVEVIINLLFFLNFGASAPEVKTQYGTYIGHLTKSRNGREVSAYEGIPYAKPPIGSLRFKEPEALVKNDQIYNATKEANSCFQDSLKESLGGILPFLDEKYRGSEDCLYLNIYVPKVKDAGKLPVMLFIHPGGYIMGSGSPQANGPAYFLDKDIIFVSINYRLSILGFLHIEKQFENLGMKDQNMALKWVNENIEAFGGDPDLITIFGLSAGSSSVFLHLYSPLSKGLFKRAIGMSGTMDCNWAVKYKEEALNVSSKIIDYLGCSKEPKFLMRCLQKMPVTELFDAIGSLKKRGVGSSMTVAPIVESESPNAFITERSIKEGSDVPLLTGVTAEEGLGIYSALLLESPTYSDGLAPLNKSYKELLPIMAYYAENPAADEITSKLVQYYIGDEGFTKETEVNFIQMLSDVLFNHGLHKSARRHNGKLYQYLNLYETTPSIIPKVKPSLLKNTMGHGDDMMFLFSNALSRVISLTVKNLKFSQFLIDLLTNFVRFGDPTPDTKLWKESDGGYRYLEFSNEGHHTMNANMFKNRMAFLDDIFPMNFNN